MSYESLYKVKEEQKRLYDLQIRIAADDIWQKQQGKSYNYLSPDRPVTNDEWKRITKCPKAGCDNWCSYLFNAKGLPYTYSDSWWWECADCHIKRRLKMIEDEKQYRKELEEQKQWEEYRNRPLTPTELRRRAEVNWNLARSREEIARHSGRTTAQQKEHERSGNYPW
jgi:hypothetical protein